MLPSRAKRPPAHESLIQIMRPIAGKGQWSIHFDISEREYALLGSIVVYWSFLEHALQLRTGLIASAAKVPMPAEARNGEFARRLAAFNKLVSSKVKSTKARAKWLLIGSKIANAKSMRDAIAHHYLTYNPKRPDQMWTTNLALAGARSQPIDEDKLMALGRLIGESNFALLHPRKPSLAELAPADGVYMSRSFRRNIARKRQ
jgi:hypothetical protein